MGYGDSRCSSSRKVDLRQSTETQNFWLWMRSLYTYGLCSTMENGPQHGHVSGALWASFLTKMYLQVPRFLVCTFGEHTCKSVFKAGISQHWIAGGHDLCST